MNSIQFTENKNFYSDTNKVNNETKELHRKASVKAVTNCMFYALVLGCIGLVKKFWGKWVNRENNNEKNLKEDDAIGTSLQSDLCIESKKEDVQIVDEKNSNHKKYEICIFDRENKTLRKEMREIDTTKFPPLKYANNNTYYAIEKVKDGKKIRIYYTKDSWDKELENNL